MTLAERPVRATDAEREELIQIEKRLIAGATIRLAAENGDLEELPESLRLVLSIAVHELVRGNRVSVVPLGAELTTQQAAEVLNISRPYLVRLLEAGEIPFRLVGTHRRLLIEDVISYRDKRAAHRREGLSRLAKQAQANGLLVD